MNGKSRLVLDTNVIVSGLLSPDGPPGRLLRAFRDSLFNAVVCEPVISEYAIVLNRPKFPFAGATALQVVTAFIEHGLWVPKLRGSGVELTDTSDQPFYDCAYTSACVLVTGNLKHFPLNGPVEVLSPREAVERFF